MKKINILISFSGTFRFSRSHVQHPQAQVACGQGGRDARMADEIITLTISGKTCTYRPSMLTINCSSKPGNPPPPEGTSTPVCIHLCDTGHVSSYCGLPSERGQHSTVSEILMQCGQAHSHIQWPLADHILVSSGHCCFPLGKHHFAFLSHLQPLPPVDCYFSVVYVAISALYMLLFQC